MNNNFVVSIPKELKNVKAKLFMGLTKRQLIGFALAIGISVPTFLFLKNFSTDIAMYGLFFTATPVIFGTIYTKDGMKTETWIKLYLEYKFLNLSKRYFKVSLKNKKVAEERKMINVKKAKSISSSSTSS